MHVDHADAWIRRLGNGTDDSKGRMRSALDRLGGVAPMLLEPVDGQDALESSGLYPGSRGEMFESLATTLASVTETAGLTLELKLPVADTRGGRRGHHTEYLVPLLDEMCEVFRLEPAAPW